MNRSTLTFSYSITAAEAKISEANLKAIKAEGRVYALDFLQDVIFEATKAYNEILASDGDGKAAGGSTREDGRADSGNVILSEAAERIATPAAAPDVCEWTEVATDALGYAWMNSSCGLVDFHERNIKPTPSGLRCHCCGKPISFKSEAANEQ
jgi:hypothetical protein